MEYLIEGGYKPSFRYYYTTDYSLDQKHPEAIFHSFTRQSLDNDYTRFTLEYTVPEGLEIVARIKEQYFKIAKKKQLGVAIKVLKMLKQVSKDFKLEDIDIKLPRNKNDNIQSKSQSFSTLMSTGVIAPEDALSMADMTTDITGVVSRGQKYKAENMQNDANNLANNNSKKTQKVNVKIGETVIS